jgi:colanic acid/amylovoran biosynthesis glycosyltransferase
VRPGTARRLAYLINQYPKTSHAWMRREILAVAGAGFDVRRFSLRRVSEPLVDPGDLEEERRTHFVLDHKPAVLLATLLVFLGRPTHFLAALRLAWFMGRRHPRGQFAHLFYLAEACYLLRRLTADPVDHLHAHFGTNSATVACLLRTLGGPSYSFTFHGPEIFESISQHGLRECLHRANFAVAISYHGLSMLKRWSDYPHWKKLHLIHCGIDGTFLDAPAAPNPRNRRLICVARLSPVKGHLVLIEALARLKQEGLDFQLALIGGGEFESEIRRVAKDFGVLGQIEFLGWKSGQAVRDEILKSQAMVLPSFDEGLPVVFMESYALRRPVISTYIAGIPELVESRVCGWVVPAGSVGALAQALRECHGLSAAALDQLGAAGRERVERDHDAAKEAARLMTLFAFPARQAQPLEGAAG